MDRKMRGERKERKKSSVSKESATIKKGYKILQGGKNIGK